jgi:hypothetical protein
VSRRRALAVPPLVLALLALLGCAIHKALEQRTTEGPAAEQFFVYTVVLQNGRQTWQDALDQKISGYLREHPEAANSLAVTKFRALRQATVGMTKEQIRILLGAPTETVTDRERLEKLARKYWPDIRDRAQEAWLYPLGWTFYFDGDRLVDITQYRP